MKTLKECLVYEVKFNNNLHDNLTEFENKLSNKIASLIGKNNQIDITINDIEINLFNNLEEENYNETEYYSAAGVIVESYIKSLLNKEITSKDYFGSELEQISTLENDYDFGDYDRYDLEVGDLCFEVKTYHKTDNKGIWLSKDQNSKIGPDGLFILVEVGIATNSIIIKDVIVRQRKNLHIASRYIKGAK